MLYPTLKIAINELLKEIKNRDYNKELEKEFNRNFFRNKAEILQKQKQLLKLERGDDYSEGDYEYWLRQNIDMNESKTEKSEIVNEEEEDMDDDLDDSEILNLEEDELNNEDDDSNKKFDPIKFLIQKLREINLNKVSNNLELSLDKSEDNNINTNNNNNENIVKEMDALGDIE